MSTSAAIGLVAAMHSLFLLTPKSAQPYTVRHAGISRVSITRVSTVTERKRFQWEGVS